jgi:hypothetical protein
MDQADVNCFAWQEFIALNWLADTTTCAADSSAPASAFGEPGAGPVVWQTYKAPGEVFLADAAPPPAWCEPQTKGATSTRPYRLSAINKFVGGPQLDLDAFTEVSPKGSWLTAQSGDLTLYDVRMNEDEFAYVAGNKLYDADKQQAVAQSNAGLQLPDDSDGKNGIGSIELKAAWIELDDTSDWPNYLTTTATVTYPGGKPTQATMGLVGLHIIHKTFNAQQFVWATFEHVDNAPTAGNLPSSGSGPQYTYYDAGCNPQTDPYKCVPNPPTQDPGPPPSPPFDAPVQAVRQLAIPSTTTNNVAGLNAWVWNLIKQSNANSVFLNYQLVDVLWPNSNTPVAPGQRTPLPTGAPQPSQAVANTTLETYVQSETCLVCHINAPIASTSGKQEVVTVTEPVLTSTATTPSEGPYGADYSFLLSKAQSPPSGGPSAVLIAGGALLVAAAGGGAAVARRRRRGAGSP